MGSLQTANIQFTEPSSTERERPMREITRQRIRRSIRSDIRQGLTRSDQRSQKDNQYSFFEFTKKFGNNEQKHKRFDEALRQFVDYRRKLDTIRQQQLEQQQQANNVFLLTRFRLDQKLAESARHKSENLKRTRKPKLVTKYGYTLKREYSDYADMLTNQDMADMEFVLHPDWFVKDQPEQPNPTQTPEQLKQDQNIDDDDGWNL